MAPSTAIGATIPSARTAPTSVVVCQWPWGTAPTGVGVCQGPGGARLPKPLPRGGVPVGPVHVRLRPRLVDEPQLGRVQGGLAGAPLVPPLPHVRAVLLGGPDRLFLYVRPS